MSEEVQRELSSTQAVNLNMKMNETSKIKAIHSVICAYELVRHFAEFLQTARFMNAL